MNLIILQKTYRVFYPRHVCRSLSKFISKY
nr:MAG TPA: hypothetical protein [Bacteriophage sp.]